MQPWNDRGQNHVTSNETGFCGFMVFDCCHSSEDSEDPHLTTSRSDLQTWWWNGSIASLILGDSGDDGGCGFNGFDINPNSFSNTKSVFNESRVMLTQTLYNNGKQRHAGQDHSAVLDHSFKEIVYRTPYACFCMPRSYLPGQCMFLLVQLDHCCCSLRCLRCRELSWYPKSIDSLLVEKQRVKEASGLKTWPGMRIPWTSTRMVAESLTLPLLPQKPWVL